MCSNGPVAYSLTVLHVGKDIGLQHYKVKRDGVQLVWLGWRWEVVEVGVIMVWVVL